MAKYKLDDILNELGVEGAASAASRKPHSIDKQPAALTSLPAVPGNQGGSTPAHPSAQPSSHAATVAVETPSELSNTANQEESQVTDQVSESSDTSVATSLQTQADSQQTNESVHENDKHHSANVTSGETAQNSERGSMGRHRDAHEHQDLNQLLVARGAAADKVAAAQAIIKQNSGRPLIEIYVEQGVDEALAQSCIADLAGMPFERVNLDKAHDGGFDGKLIQRLTPDYCRKQMVLPLRVEGSRPVIGVTIDNVFLADDIKSRLGVPSIKMVLVTAYDIRGAMEILGEGTQSAAEEDISSILSDVEEGDVQVEKKQTDETDLEKAAGTNPVIRLVNKIIQTAMNEGASDIHIEPSEKKLKIRYRIDGELVELIPAPASLASAVTSRLKIMANLDISERRVPQDGRIRCKVGGRAIDLRMSTIPSGHGEKTVLRILDSRSISVELSQLGFHEDQMTIWQKVIDAPHGINLVTGPTGSGKTTTLYASLRTLDKNSMNVCTVEDPIEYHLDGITQTQMHEKIGMTFALALRALLRQDPDVIMLGEIRDLETAMVAVQAALTGHLVLSTLHTNDAPSSITRLVNIGLEPFLVGAAVNAVLAQRLIRKLCSACKKEEEPSEDMQEYLTMNGIMSKTLFMQKGCDKCRKNGYSGRVGIYELLAVDDQLRDMIARNPNVAEFRRICIERGMVTLRQDGMRKVVGGITTISEVLRVTEGH